MQRKSVPKDGGLMNFDLSHAPFIFLFYSKHSICFLYNVYNDGVFGEQCEVLKSVLYIIKLAKKDGKSINYLHLIIYPKKKSLYLSERVIIGSHEATT